MDEKDELTEEFKALLQKINVLKHHIFNPKKKFVCQGLDEEQKKDLTDYNEEKNHYNALLKKALKKTNVLTKMVSELLSIKSIEAEEKIIQVNSLKEEITKNQYEIQKLTDSFKSESQLKNELELLLIDSQISNAELQKKIDDIKLEYDMTIKKLEQNKFDIKNELNKLMVENFKLHQKNTEFEEKTKHLEQEIILLQNSLQKQNITKIDFVNKTKDVMSSTIPFIGIQKNIACAQKGNQIDCIISNSIITNSLNFQRSQSIEKNVADSSNLNEESNLNSNISQINITNSNKNTRIKSFSSISDYTRLKIDDHKSIEKKNINKEKYKPLNVLQKPINYKMENKKNVFSVYPPSRKRKLFDPKNFDFESYWNNMNKKTDD